MTNYCKKCEHQDYESCLVRQPSGGYLCFKCHNLTQVEHPSHYQGTGLEAIEVIEAFNLGFNLGNAIKYLLRAGKKGDAIQDLEKAQWYICRELTRLGEGNRE